MSNPLKARIRTALIAAGDKGCTCDELVLALNAPHQSVGGRLGDLRKEGLIQHNGKKRPTRQGKNAAVHVVTTLKPPGDYTNLQDALNDFGAALREAHYAEGGIDNAMKNVKSICQNEFVNEEEAFRRLTAKMIKDSSVRTYRHSLRVFYNWLEGYPVRRTTTGYRGHRAGTAPATHRVPPRRKKPSFYTDHAVSLKEAGRIAPSTKKAFGAFYAEVSRDRDEHWKNSSIVAIDLLLDQIGALLEEDHGI
jgi:hypothetical protein